MRSQALARAAAPAAVIAEAGLGSLPAIALAAAGGLLALAVADTLARLDVPGAGLLWWVGLLALVLPCALRLLGRDASRAERMAILVVLGLGLYAVKILHSPGSFTLFDEFHHWATLDDIVVSGRLFTPNNILLASPYYPGLEIVSDLLVRSGFSVWEAGILVVGAARLLLMLSLFLLYERVSDDARLASVATLVYAANPSFLFFDAQYAYESLALPLAVFTVWCVARRERAMVLAIGGGSAADATRRQVLGFTACLLLGIGAVVVSHHITSLALSAFLVAWLLVATLQGRAHHPSPEPAPPLGAPGPSTDGPALPASPGSLVGPALLALTATVAWMLWVASVTVGYLAPAIGSALDQVLSLIGGEAGSRELFRSATGAAAPPWEQALGYASVALVVLAMPLGLGLIWRRYRRHALALTLGLTALVFPATLLARLTVRGAELAARSTEFVFVGVGFVVALAALAALEALSQHDAERSAHGWRARLFVLPPAARISRRGLVAGVAAAGVLFSGAAVLGIPIWARLPGPYLVSADPRSVEPQGIAAASWTLAQLGPGHRFLSDRTDRTLLATYGRQHPISAVGDQVDAKRPYFDTTLTEDDLRVLKRAGTGFVIADLRLPTSLPFVGVYVERGELTANGPWTEPMSASALAKWDATPGSYRVYDSGDIHIHDIRTLTDADR